MCTFFFLRWCRVGLGLALLLASPLALRAQSAAYWNADPDSLRRVLAGQHTDTARLRTLRYLVDVSLSEYSAQTYSRLLPELIALTGRLHAPDHRAYQLMQAANQLLARTPPQVAAIDSLQAAVAELDRLGRPALVPLSFLLDAYNILNQPERRRTYYQAKLVEYQRRGDRVDEAFCVYGLAGYYYHQGDYDQAIGYYLRAGTMLRTIMPNFYRNELVIAGTVYVAWGNDERALWYFRQFLALATPLPGDQNLAGLANQCTAEIYLRQHRYALARQYIDRALASTRLPGMPAANRVISQASGLVIKSAIQLAQGQVGAAGQLLPRAQHLVDSLHLPLSGFGGIIELDATWARYYTARHEPARAEAAWLAAYRKAAALHVTPLRLAYLRELGHFYQQQGQPARAAPYALAAATLADSLETAQRVRHVSRYEVAQADQAQQARIAGLQLARVQDAARARRQRLLLAATLLVLALVAALGYVLWRGSRRRQRANEVLSQQKAEIQTQRDQLDASLTELRATQQQLIQKEKMASLGELTAGIAHEIQNPLNFVNNFSEVSAELLAELRAALATDPAEAAALADDVAQNLAKINQHGQRAAGIVRGMLEHSRASTGKRQLTDLNALADEYLRLAYHGLRARDKGFNAELQTDFAAGLPPVQAVPGDLGRVLLNLFTNAFYAVQQRQRAGEAGYAPVVSVRTSVSPRQVQLSVQDNGTGMSAAVQAKIFQPFFTTKPTGEGTGLGLSLSYDIITQGHGGTLIAASTVGVGTTFTVTLPVSTLASEPAAGQPVSVGGKSPLG